MRAELRLSHSPSRSEKGAGIGFRRSSPMTPFDPGYTREPFLTLCRTSGRIRPRLSHRIPS